MSDVTMNPLREGLQVERMPEPNAVVIFGASGDLTKRKLVPALYNMELEGLLPNAFAVIGFARRSIPDEEFRAQMLDGINNFSRNRPAKPEVWSAFSEKLHYCAGNFDDPQAYQALAAALDALDAEHGTAGNRLFYLATSPEYFPVIIKHLGEAGLNQSPKGGWVRVIIEKPFGRDLATAQELNRTVSARSSTKTRSTASTTTWARRPSRTSWCSALPTAFSSRSGTECTSITCRSRWPKRWAWRGAAAITTPPASSATWSKTTCSSS